MSQPQSPSEYLHNKNKTEQTFFSYHPILGGFYYPNGLPISKEDYEAMYPIASKVQAPSLRYKGENISIHQKLL